MAKRNPYKFPRERPALDNWRMALKKSQHRPPIGVTQGGSSRKSRGAVVAATTAEFRPKGRRKEKDDG